MNLHNVPLSGSPEKVVQKSSRVPHDETIRKAVTLEKPSKNLLKTVRLGPQSVLVSNPPDLPPEMFRLWFLWFRLNLLTVSMGGEKFLKVPCLPLSRRWDVY